MSDSESKQTAVQVRDGVMNASDWEYTLAGHLIGTDWVHPERGVDTIRRVQTTTEREQGHRHEHPEVVFKHAGIRIPLSGFLRRIDPTDIGDIEPSDKTAERIVEIQETHSWRSLSLTSDGN